MVAVSSLHVQMYRDTTALRERFRKNLYALTGARGTTFGVALLLFGLVAQDPWIGVLLGAPPAHVPLALLVAVRVCGAVLFRHGVRSSLLHPVGSLLLLGIAPDSLAGDSRGALRWKGRRIGGAPEPTVSTSTNTR